jgi:hypothetical protein
MELQHIIYGRDADETGRIDRRWLSDELGEHLQRRSSDELEYGFLSRELSVDIALGM